MADNIEKGRHGGARPGAGRPCKENGSRLYTFRAGGEMAEYLNMQEHRTEFIKHAIQKAMADEEPDFSALGTVIPATKVKEMNVNFFDIGIVAGFPVPLDNDEKAQSIELLKMLCPYPESSYLIRVKGNSMIDAGINNGDIVIVDKSNRNPSPDQVAVCEYNGEYTLKHFEMRGDAGWLIPANPEYPEIKVTNDDTFRIWGTVTYVIHKPMR